MKAVSTSNFITILVVSLLVREGHGAADFVDPPSGTLIVNFEGTLENEVTITCNITHIIQNVVAQIGTQWSIENFRNSPNLLSLPNNNIPEITIEGDLRPSGSTFRNRLIISALTSQLDGVIIHCGTGEQPREANYPVRIYRPPNLQDNLMLNIEENTLNVPVELSQSPAAFPEPTLFNWNKDGQAFTSPTLTYSSVTFTPLRRSDTGNYVVSATNYIIDSNIEQVGSDIGSFFLNVIYGPSFRVPGPTQQYALLDESLSLVCGTDLDSNPQATITWTAPDGTTKMDDARYDLDNGPGIVRLNFTHTILSDTGIWMCNIEVESEHYIVSNGSLIRVNSSLIGVRIQQNIRLTVIVTPNEPQNLVVDTIEATYIIVCWDAPFNSSVSYYLINARSLNDTGRGLVINTSINSTFFNVTGLLPGTTYELTIVAVSQGGDVVARSQPSDPIVDTTGVTVPELFCNASVSFNGTVTVTWSYIHTGGLPLTNVSVTYIIYNNLSPIPIPLISVDTTSVTIPDLKAGFEYTFNVTAVNSEGSSSTVCGPITPELVLSGSSTNLIAAIVGGVVGGLVGILLITLLGFGIAAMTLGLRKRGNQIKLEAVYQDPDNLQQYTPKKDHSIELEECPAYVEKSKGEIKLEECPAYGQVKKDEDIKLEECPAYIERKDDIKLEECPACGQQYL